MLIEDEEGSKSVEIHFHDSNVQPVRLTIRPLMSLLWGNFQDLPERHPPWERDDS
jgi:hypothetical protein